MRNGKVFVATVFALALLLASAAYAVDGVVLINQNTALAGLGGCDSPGFPVTICQGGSYRLSGNLSVPANATGISITADNVSIDMNGFSIVGPGTCSGTPVPSCSGNSGGFGVQSGNDNITVRNGSVVGMGDGVALFGRGELVESVNAKWISDIGIFVEFGTIRLSSATQNGFAGIWVAGGGSTERNTAVGNQYGVLTYFGSAIGNVANSNQTGLGVLRSTFGSNSMQDNTTDLVTAGGSTSQNNNNCSGSSC